MTIQINVATNEKEFKRKIKLFEKKHMPEATANAINKVGHKVVSAEQAQLKQKLDRPTPFTVKSVVMPTKLQAKPNDLSALVIVKDIASKYLRYVYEGGVEKASKTSMLVPVTSAGGDRLNKFGNIIGKRNNKADAPQKVFFARNTLWRAVGKDKLKMLAVTKPFIQHRKFLDYFKIATSVVKNNYKKELDKQMKKATRK